MAIFMDILLLCVGGIVTYIVMYTIYRVKERGERTPSLVWRKFPSVSISKLGLTATSLSIKNEGTKAAKNVRAVVSFPKYVTIESFEIVTSEPAMNYELSQFEGSNNIDLNFPFFNKELECIIALIAKELDPSDIKISIVGDEDAVGKERIFLPAKDLDKLREKIKRMNKFVTLFIPIASLFFFVFYTIFSITMLSYNRQMDIAQVYFQSGKYELALKEYNKIQTAFFFRSPTRLYYELAKTYAMKSDDLKAVHYLKKVMKENRDLAHFASVDESFDLIRSSEKMKAFLAQFN